MKRFGLSLAHRRGVAGRGAGDGAAGAASLAPGQSVTGELSPATPSAARANMRTSTRSQGRRGQRVQLDLGSERFRSLSGGDRARRLLPRQRRCRGRRRSTDSRIVFAVPGRRRLPRRRHQLPPRRDRRLPARSLGARRRCRGHRAGRRPADPRSARRSTAGSPRATAASPRANIPTATASAPGAASASRIALTGDKLDPICCSRRPDGTRTPMTTARIDGQPSLNSRIDTVLAEDGDYVDHRHLLPARRDRRLSAQPRSRAPACRARSACPAAPA